MRDQASATGLGGDYLGIIALSSTSKEQDPPRSQQIVLAMSSAEADDATVATPATTDLAVTLSPNGGKVTLGYTAFCQRQWSSMQLTVPMLLQHKVYSATPEAALWAAVEDAAEEPET